jgi:hypothetical protein
LSATKPEHRPLEFTHRGVQITVRRNEGDPESLTWIEIAGKQFYLHGVLSGMTRREVAALALEWLLERPQHLKCGPNAESPGS